MPIKMLAATFNGFGKPLIIEHVSRPTPRRGQLLVRLEASGVCHSDVHIWKGGMRPQRNPSPFILGHEGVGTVTAVGADVSEWNIGDRAGVAWLHNTCGTCDECSDGEESFCQTQNASGFNVPGTFAEYTIADARFAAKLPQGDAAIIAPLLCAGLTAYGAIKRAELKAGETCVVFGCGGLGLYAVQIASRLGARVIAIDTDTERLQTAATFGAETTMLASPLLAQQWDSSNIAHVCINFAPTTATWKVMVAAIRPRGRIISAAMVSEPVALNQEWLASSGVRITGTSVGTRTQMKELIDLHARSPLNGEITRISLQDVTNALVALENGVAKGRYCIVF